MKKIGFIVLGIAGLFTFGILLFNFVVMPMLVHQRGTVIVPDLRSLSQAGAEKALADMGLNMRIARQQNDAEIPEGFVVSQSPRANDAIKEGRTVEVVLSLGARTERLAELGGMSLRQVRGLLERAHLRVGRVSRVVVEGPAREEVIASRPVAGAELVEGTAVDMVIAVGGRKREFVMPDLRGQDLLFIKEKLREQGFRVGAVRYETREGVFPNTVVGQVPEAGGMIREGDSIELVAASSG